MQSNSTRTTVSGVGPRQMRACLLTAPLQLHSLRTALSQGSLRPCARAAREHSLPAGGNCGHGTAVPLPHTHATNARMRADTGACVVAPSPPKVDAVGQETSAWHQLTSHTGAQFVCVLCRLSVRSVPFWPTLLFSFQRSSGAEGGRSAVSNLFGPLFAKHGAARLLRAGPTDGIPN